VGALLGVIPLFAYTPIFLAIPTLIVVIGAYLNGNSRPTLGSLSALARPQIVSAFVHSTVLSAVTAVLGAVFGALLAYAVSTGREGGQLRRVISSLCGVLAQFGGVTLAFAFAATAGALVSVLAALSLFSWSIRPVVVARARRGR
jgi:putative spermidine/putrescine transport system permease protein